MNLLLVSDRKNRALWSCWLKSERFNHYKTIFRFIFNSYLVYFPSAVCLFMCLAHRFATWSSLTLPEEGNAKGEKLLNVGCRRLSPRGLGCDRWRFFYTDKTRWAMPWMTPVSSVGGGCRWDDVLYNFSLQTWLRYRFACDYILTSYIKCLSLNLMLTEIDILRNHSCLIEEPIRNAIGLSIIWRGQVCWHRIGWHVFGGRGSGEGVLFKLAEVSKTD